MFFYELDRENKVRKRKNKESDIFYFINVSIKMGFDKKENAPLKPCLVS